MEFHYIKQYDTFSPNGYNLTLGGQKGSFGRKMSKKTKNTISKKKINIPIHTEMHKKKLSDRWKGENNPNYGGFSKEHLLKLSKVKLGKKHSKETIEKRSKKWLVLFPNKKELEITNLNNFCRNNNLNYQKMVRTIGTSKTYNGYKCRRVER